jgi:hypothetical protein
VKILSALLLLSLTAFARADGGVGLSEAEHEFCQRQACFSQTVVTNVIIEEVKKESLQVEAKTGDMYLIFEVTGKREYTPGKFIATEYLISQWIGNGKSRIATYERNVREFAGALKKISLTRKEINLVVRGSASGMVGEFPLLGFFSSDGQFFFLERTAAAIGTSDG